MSDPAPASPAAQAPSSAPAGATLSQELTALWRELPGLVSDRVDLFALELQRAGVALVQVAMLVVAATVLGVTVWLLAWAAAISAMVDAGLPLGLALGLMLVVNAAAAWWAVARAKRLLQSVPLTATFRHLAPRIDPSTRQPTQHAKPAQPGPGTDANLNPAANRAS